MLRINAMIWSTLCISLLVATLGIIILMGLHVNVAKEVSLLVGAQWGALLAVAMKRETK